MRGADYQATVNSKDAACLQVFEQLLPCLAVDGLSFPSVKMLSNLPEEGLPDRLAAKGQHDAGELEELETVEVLAGGKGAQDAFAHLGLVFGLRRRGREEDVPDVPSAWLLKRSLEVGSRLMRTAAEPPNGSQ